MQRVTIRLPEHVVAAYDDADGNRSALMRRRLIEAVEDGDVSGVDADLRALVEAEGAKDRTRLDRRRASFRERCYDHYADAYRRGLVSPADAEAMRDSWDAEAALYGPAYAAFVDAVVEWYADNWHPVQRERPQWPEPSLFMQAADPEDINAPDRLVETVETFSDDPESDEEKLVQKLSQFHPRAVAREAVRKAADGGPNGE